MEERMEQQVLNPTMENMVGMVVVQQVLDMVVAKQVLDIIDDGPLEDDYVKDLPVFDDYPYEEEIVSEMLGEGSGKKKDIVGKRANWVDTMKGHRRRASR
ncbi:hypothetical protein Tco_1011748 [Tanacetum coccineum]